MLMYLLLSGAATSASFACVCSVHDANAKISPDMPFPPTLTVPLAAARRELVHWQVAVRDGSSSTELIPTAEALGIASNITIRRVAMHELNTTFVPTHPPGRYPDALLPLSMHAPGTAFDGKFLIFSFYNMTEYFTNLMMYFVIIKKNSAAAYQVFWLSLKVPHNTTAGMHVADVRIASSDCSCHTSLQLKVAEFALPLASTQQTGSQFLGTTISTFTPRY